MADVPGRDVSISGMTEPEAREFHSIFMSSFLGFTAVAVVAHILVWFWKPWLGSASVANKHAMAILHHAITALT